MTPARPRVHLRFRRRFCGLMDGDKVAGGNVSRGDGDTRGLKRRRVYTQKTDVPVTPHPHPHCLSLLSSSHKATQNTGKLSDSL